MCETIGGAYRDHTYVESDWNPLTYSDAVKAPATVAYAASKVEAERSAWSFQKEHPELEICTSKFDLKRVHPILILFQQSAHL